MMIFGFAFGGMGQENTAHNIAIVNYNQGATLPTGGQQNFGNNLTSGLKDATYLNSNVKLFNVTETSESQADTLLKQRTVDAELIIPNNYSASMVSLIMNSTGLQTTSVNNTISTPIIRGDEGYSNFFAAQSALNGVLTQYQDNVVTGFREPACRNTGSTTNTIY